MSSALLQNQTGSPIAADPRLSQNPDYAALMGEAAFAVENVDGSKLFALERDVRALDATSLEPNALGGADFMLAATRHFPETLAPQYLAVWKRQQGQPGQLVGLFPLQHGGLQASGGTLNAWQHPFTANGVPLIRAEVAEAVMTAVLLHLSGLPQRFAALCLKHIPVEGRFFAALQNVASTLGLQLDRLAEHNRAAHRPGQDAGAANKTRRRQARRLAKTGSTSLTVNRSYDEVRPALERFLALEAGGWKGEAGTALLCNPGDANFARALIWSAARSQNACIGELTHADRTIASVIVLTAGNRAFTWKIAFDPAFAAYSPGALLLQDMTTALLGGGEIDEIDSCAQAGNPLAESVWTGNQPMADIMVSLRDPTRVAYRAALARENLRRSLRERVKRIVHALRGTKDQTRPDRAADGG